MARSTGLIIVAAIMIALVPVVPQMVVMRARVLHALHLNSFAAWHEENAETIVVVVRIILVAFAVVLLVIGLSGR